MSSFSCSSIRILFFCFSYFLSVFFFFFFWFWGGVSLWEQEAGDGRDRTAGGFEEAQRGRDAAAFQARRTPPVSGAGGDGYRGGG